MPRDDERQIPRSAADLTAEWFSDALGEAPGVGQGACVTAVRVETIGTGVGFMGEVHRCHLTWDRSPGGPDSVIVKLPTSHPTNFALGDGLQVYEREIVVYRELSDSLGIPMPQLLYSDMDPDPAPWMERLVLFLFSVLPLRAINWVVRQFLKVAGRSTRRYVLVIEDVADARPPSQVRGGSSADVAAALKVLARFHAANWMRHDASRIYRRIWPVDRGTRAYQAGYLRNRETFVERFGDRLGAEMIDRLDDIQRRLPELDRRLSADPWTLLHGDFRLDNVLFRPDGEIVVLDYQGLCRGRPGLDVAYFITTALTIKHRDQEEQLLRTYHDALTAAGVHSYSREMLAADCRDAKEILAHRIVGAGDVVDTELDEAALAEGGHGDHAESLIDVIQLRVLDWLD